MLVFSGSVIGALLGLAHAAYVFRRISRPFPASTPPNYIQGFYYAIWTLVLWVLLGTYVLVVWLVGVIFYILFKAFR